MLQDDVRWQLGLFFLVFFFFFLPLRLPGCFLSPSNLAEVALRLVIGQGQSHHNSCAPCSWGAKSNKFGLTASLCARLLSRPFPLHPAAHTVLIVVIGSSILSPTLKCLPSCELQDAPCKGLTWSFQVDPCSLWIPLISLLEGQRRKWFWAGGGSCGLLGLHGHLWLCYLM